MTGSRCLYTWYSGGASSTQENFQFFSSMTGIAIAVKMLVEGVLDQVWW